MYVCMCVCVCVCVCVCLYVYNTERAKESAANKSFSVDRYL